MSNRVFLGPVSDAPATVNLPVNGALLPCTFVEETATQLSPITTALAKRPLILSNVEFKDQDIKTAYKDGDTGVAYEALPGQRYQVAMGAATYAKGDALTIGAAGRMIAATAATVVVAWFDGTPGAVTAGALSRVIIANSYTVPV